MRRRSIAPKTAGIPLLFSYGALRPATAYRVGSAHPCCERTRRPPETSEAKVLCTHSIRLFVGDRDKCAVG